MTGVRLYFRLVTAAARARMQYRASFVMAAVGNLVVHAVEFLALWSLFHRFGQVRGWTLPEVALFYGLINLAFAIADTAGRGFDDFASMVKSGDFDRVLLRPRAAALQIAAQDLTLKRIGRFTLALGVLLWAAAELDLRWSAAKVALALAAVAGGAAVFYGLLVFQATIAFWTIESLEIINALTYGGAETAQYPLAIYRPWMRRFFTALVPLACVNYFPALALLGRPDPLGSPAWLGWVSPGAGAVFLFAALALWRVGVRHYRSTGS
jgi:ABC-2 type transport system permease protein